jgi:hypothetical protein
MIQITYEGEYICDEDHSFLYEKNKDGYSWMDVKKRLICLAEAYGFKVIQNDKRRGSGSVNSGSMNLYYGHPDEIIAIGVLAHEVGHIRCGHTKRGGYPVRDDYKKEKEAWLDAEKYILKYMDEVHDKILASKNNHLSWLMSLKQNYRYIRELGI